MSMYTTAQLLAANEQKFKFDPLFLRLFFRESYPFTTEKVYLSQIPGLVNMALYVSPIVSGEVIRSRGGSTSEFTPGYVKPKHEVNPQMTLRRLPDEDPQNLADPAYRRRRIIMQNMRDEELAIAQVEEMQAVSAVLKGKYTMTGEAFDPVEVDMGRSAANNITQSGGTEWSKRDKSTYDPTDDNGKYTAQDATTAQKGIIQLSSATNSTSETLAATPKAVKAANDNAEKRLQKDQNGADIPGKDTFTKNIGACRAFGGSVSTTTGNWTTAQFIEWLDSQGAFNHPYWMCKGSWSYGNNKIITDTGCGNIHLAGAVIEVMGIKSAMTIRITTPTTSTGGGTTNAQFTYINHGTDYSPGWRRDYNSRNKPTASEIGALPSGGTAVSSVNLSSKGRVLHRQIFQQASWLFSTVMRHRGILLKTIGVKQFMTWHQGTRYLFLNSAHYRKMLPGYPRKGSFRSGTAQPG